MPRIVPKTDAANVTSSAHSPVVTQKVSTGTKPFTPKAPEAAPPAATAPTPVPTPAAPTSEVTISTPDDARRFAALAREEKRIREAKQALKMEQARLKQSAPAPSGLSKVLQERGITEEQLVAYLTGNINPDPVEQRFQAVTGKLSAVEESAQKALKALEEQQTTQRQQAVRQMRYDAEELAKSDDRFQAIKAAGAYDEVTKRIEEKFDSDNIVMSVEEAMTAVENELQEQILALAKLPKFAALLAPPPAEPPKPVSQAATLTHAAAASASPARTKAELRQRMIDRLNAMRSGA